MPSTFISAVEDAFEITGRGIVVVPGIPHDGALRIQIGDPLAIKVEGRRDVLTSVRGLEMIGRPVSMASVAKRTQIGTPILLGPQVTLADIPAGAEIWLCGRGND
ncbi:hypothetical protein [Erythrobacter sp. BLCC-B19]|uniref:hypothetical protein n=1 Tax=Erythrobacter sp. BLCC-B19 TaxID=3025315 RepID=UPI002360FFAC|nr:hypothetical protein [Erythrobacter sp. BLCC-B19]WDA40099.1 hypothetical protein PS060_11045 [Erythrobacter sp. BLCC-B19]